MAGGYSLGVQAGVSSRERRAAAESAAMSEIFKQRAEYNKSRSAAYATIEAAKVKAKSDAEVTRLDGMYNLQKERLRAEADWKKANLEDRQKRDKDRQDWDKAVLEEAGKDERHVSGLLKEMGYDPTRTLVGAKMWRAVTEGKASMQEVVNLLGADTPNNQRRDRDAKIDAMEKDRRYQFDVRKEQADQEDKDRNFRLNVKKAQYTQEKDNRDFEYNAKKNDRDFKYRASQDRVDNAFKAATTFGKASKEMKESFNSPEFKANLAQKFGFQLNDPEFAKLTTALPFIVDEIDQMTKEATRVGATPEQVNAKVDEIMARHGLADHSDVVMDSISPYLKLRTLEQQSQSDLSQSLGYHAYDLKSDPTRAKQFRDAMFADAPKEKSQLRKAAGYLSERFLEFPGYNQTVHDMYGGEGLDEAIMLQVAKQSVKMHGGSYQDAIKKVREQVVSNAVISVLPTSLKEYMLAGYGDNSRLKARWGRDRDAVVSLALNYAAGEGTGKLLQGGGALLKGTANVLSKFPVIGKGVGALSEGVGKIGSYVESKLTSEGLIGDSTKAFWNFMTGKVPKKAAVAEPANFSTVDFKQPFKSGDKLPRNLKLPGIPEGLSPTGMPSQRSLPINTPAPPAPLVEQFKVTQQPPKYNPGSLEVPGFEDMVPPEPVFRSTNSPYGASMPEGYVPREVPPSWRDIPEIQPPPGPEGEIVMPNFKSIPGSVPPGEINLQQGWQNIPSIPEPQMALPEVSSGTQPFPTPMPGAIMESYNPGPASVGPSLMHADLTPPPERLLADELARSIKHPDESLQLARSLSMPEAGMMPSPPPLQPELTTIPDPIAMELSKGPQPIMEVRGEPRFPVKGVNPEADVFNQPPALKVGSYYRSGIAGGSKQYTKAHEGYLEEISQGGKAILRLPNGSKKSVSARRLVEVVPPEVELKSAENLITMANQAIAPHAEYFYSVGALDEKKVSVAILQMNPDERAIFQQMIATGNQEGMLALLKKILQGT